MSEMVEGAQAKCPTCGSAMVRDEYMTYRGWECKTCGRFDPYEPLPLPALAAGHELCEDSDCRTCSATHNALQHYIEQRTYVYKTRWEDVLGNYRRWLETVCGVYCETGFGWADSRYFAEENVHGYILHDIVQSADPENADDPSMQVEVDIRVPSIGKEQPK